jgi:L,D-peptidoglycan transpeptidase YkuD (ErfK/YbiS/YcfS/YnhG family)
MQRELVFENLAQSIIIINEQNFFGGGHGAWTFARSGDDTSFTIWAREATHVAVSKTITCFHVRAISQSSARGFLQFGCWTYPCLLGKNGSAFSKREGDGKSPKGKFKMTAVAFRPDRVRRPRTLLPLKPLRPDQGWCDDVSSFRYNRPVKLPFAGGHEDLCRTDCCYDIVAFTDHNQRPRIKGAGSAIFFHLTRPGQMGTEGCIAVSERNARNLLSRCSGSITLWI